MRNKRANWEHDYREVLSHDSTFIPIVGIKIVIGVTSDGRRQFAMDVDTDTDHVNWLEVAGMINVVAARATRNAEMQMGGTT